VITPDGTTPLDQVRVWLRDLAESYEPTNCPVCGQRVQIYKRGVHARMARDLIKLHLAGPQGEWLYLPNVLGINGGDTAKLVYWLLIESDEGVREDGSNRVGWWRVTDLGRDFVRGSLAIPKQARVYNQRFLGYVDRETKITIKDALGKEFNYDELMMGDQ
jgi:hypothetical protein